MATTAALILFAAITTYAVFGGADFGQDTFGDFELRFKRRIRGIDHK